MTSLLLFAANPLQSLTTLAPFVLLLVVFYMFMIAPGRKRQKDGFFGVFLSGSVIVLARILLLSDAGWPS